MKFTKDAIAGLTMPVGKTDHIEWDPETPGFGVRVRASGSKTWLIQTRLKSRENFRESLGDVRKITLEDARGLARKRFAQIELGINPRAEQKALIAAAELKKHTLEIVSDAYLAARSVGADGKRPMRPRTLNAARLHFKVHWAPLMPKAAGEITREDVAKQLRNIVAKHGRTAAARARGNLSALYSWAMKSEYPIVANPVLSTHSPVQQDESRERVLDNDELRWIWAACSENDFGRIVRLLMLTACRREEIGWLTWREFDDECGRLLIPGTRSKNHQPHSLRLPAEALAILRSIKPNEGRAFIFGKRGRGGFSAWGHSKLIIDMRIAQMRGTPLPEWRLHDIRRTVRTGLGMLGVAPHVAEMVLGHIKGKSRIERVYDRYDYGREKGEALAKWAEHLAAIVAEPPSNVVQLRA